MVLDPRAPLGACVGHVGRRTWLRELVPAGIRQPSGFRVVRPYRQPVARLGRPPSGAFRRAGHVRSAPRGLAPPLRRTSRTARRGAPSAPRCTPRRSPGAGSRRGRAVTRFGPRRGGAERQRIRGLRPDAIESRRRSRRRPRSPSGCAPGSWSESAAVRPDTSRRADGLGQLVGGWIGPGGRTLAGGGGQAAAGGSIRRVSAPSSRSSHPRLAAASGPSACAQRASSYRAVAIARPIFLLWTDHAVVRRRASHSSARVDG